MRGEPKSHEAVDVALLAKGSAAQREQWQLVSSHLIAAAIGTLALSGMQSCLQRLLVALLCDLTKAQSDRMFRRARGQA